MLGRHVELVAATDAVPQLGNSVVLVGDHLVVGVVTSWAGRGESGFVAC